MFDDANVDDDESEGGAASNATTDEPLFEMLMERFRKLRKVLT